MKVAIAEKLRGYEALLADYAGMLNKADDIGLNVLGNDLQEVQAALEPAAALLTQCAEAMEATRQIVGAFAAKGFNAAATPKIAEQLYANQQSLTALLIQLRGDTDHG